MRPGRLDELLDDYSIFRKDPRGTFPVSSFGSAQKSRLTNAMFEVREKSPFEGKPVVQGYYLLVDLSRTLTGALKKTLERAHSTSY